MRNTKAGLIMPLFAVAFDHPHNDDPVILAKESSEEEARQRIANFQGR